MCDTESSPGAGADTVGLQTARLRQIQAELKSGPIEPETVGDYRVVRKIDEGGMGVVYEARHQRLGQRVALKVIRPGLMTPHMLRRFEYEATVLARLDHPGIAKVHYAGIFEAGAGPQPYFAMEYVEGHPLDDYLKEHRSELRLRELIELFHGICEAVQHAHGKGIVHRDLKPDNILITVERKPKVLDFGVARATDGDTQAVTLQSESGAVIGTIPYMAPEQIRGQVHEIEQATDVYALGVIGYEILADRMPYAVRGKSLPEAARIICEEEPSRLSGINRSLRGDVETIVQKAMEKEKSRRYDSAGALADDVKRYLDYEPINAIPPSAWYNLRKFASRNRLVVGSGLVIVLVICAGAITSLLFAVHARRQQRAAEAANLVSSRVNQVFNEMLFVRLPTARVEPSLLALYSAGYGPLLCRMGRMAEAEEPLRDALERLRSTGQVPRKEARAVFQALAQVYESQNRADEAAALRTELEEASAPATAPSVARPQ